MDDLISRQAAIDSIHEEFDECLVWDESGQHTADEVERILYNVPSAQPGQTDCDYCHEDRDGFVKPIEKNCHASVRFGMDGWELSLSAKGWHGSAKIRFCPMCGRELSHG